MSRSGRGQKSSWHTTLREFYKELIKKKNGSLLYFVTIKFSIVKKNHVFLDENKCPFIKKYIYFASISKFEKPTRFFLLLNTVKPVLKITP
jgi:hypothetical protein